MITSKIEKFDFISDLVDLMQFFSESGYACPVLKNPADHYLKTVNKDFEQVNINSFINSPSID